MLEILLNQQASAFLTIFFRIGATMMVLPGVGEAYVPPRVRLLFAITVSVLLMPLMAATLPPLPDSPWGMSAVLVRETLIGLAVGGISRLLLSAMHTLGMILAFQSSLSSAVLFDPTQAGQGSAFGNLLSFLAVILIFGLDLHHLLLRGMEESYTLFPVGTFPGTEDLFTLVLHAVSQAFRIAVQLCMPFLVVGLLVNLAGGIISKLMPTFQVFFILMAPQILMTFAMLAFLLGVIMVTYMGYLEQALMNPLEL